MQPLETLSLERPRLRGRIIMKHGCLLHLAKLQANALAVLEVDCGKKNQSYSLPPMIRRTTKVDTHSSHEIAVFVCDLKPQFKAPTQPKKKNTPTHLTKPMLLPDITLKRKPPCKTLNDTDAIDIWIARWLNIRRIDIVRRYGCDPRRIYEIWEGTRHPESRDRALKVFLKRYPTLKDRVDFGKHRRIPRTHEHPDQLPLFTESDAG